MARSHAQIVCRVWADDDFTGLSPEAQRMYFLLLSQPNLNYAGVLPLTVRRWANGSTHTTSEDIADALHELQDGRFVVVDYDTEELLIRSFIRNDGLWKQWKMLAAARRDALATASAGLRQALLDDVRRIPLAECGEKTRAEVEREANTLVTGLAEGLATASASPCAGPPEGGAEGSRGRAPAAPPPPPPPTPSVPPSAGAVAQRPPQGLALVGDDFPETTQALMAGWLDNARKRPPKDVIGHVGKHVKAMLGEGIDANDVRRGLAAWSAKGLHPSALPAVVNEVMNAQPQRRPSTTDQRVAAGLELAARYGQMDAS